MEYCKNFDYADAIYFCKHDLIWKNEEWRDITDYEGYYKVSNIGKVKSLNYNGTGREQNLKLLPHTHKYLTVWLMVNSVKKRFYVHRLVGITFIPNPENKPEVNHIGLYEDGRQGNKKDNRFFSLQWNTVSENKNHALKHGLSKEIGEGQHKSILTNKTVLEIRELGAKSIHPKELALIYGVNICTIRDVLCRRTWKHI